MFINREKLTEIIAQEIRNRLRELAEAADDSKGDDAKSKRPRKPTTADAEDSPSPKGEGPPGPQVDPETDPGLNADPSDDEGIDAAGNAGEEPSGAVNNEISGKVVQAITIEPQSKVLPGAKEIVISFNDSTDALRILVTATGQAKFFWRNQLHDVP